MIAGGIVVEGPVGPLVNDAGLRLPRGACVGVIGESGSGKTMLLRSLIDLLPEGVHRSAGAVSTAAADGELRALPTLAGWRGHGAGMVFQDPLAALDPSMRVGRFISEVVRHHSGRSRLDAAHVVATLLGEVGFAEPERIARSFPHQMSNGQRQRVVLAVALASEPDVLLCDEAPSALDTTPQAQIIDLPVGLQASRGLSVVFVTHDLAVANQICDQIGVMLDGRVLETGPTTEVLHRPRHPYSAALLDAYRTGRELRAPEAAGAGPSVCPFRHRCAEATSDCDGAIPWVDAAAVRSGSSCVHDTRPPVLWDAS